MRARVRILARNKVGPVGREARNFWSRTLHRVVVRIEHGEWRSAHEGCDSVQLPSAQRVLVPGMGLSPKWQLPLIAENEAMACIEQIRSAFGSEIEWILRQVILSGNRFRR